MSKRIVSPPNEEVSSLARAIEYCSTHECALYSYDASVQERRRIAADLSARLEHATRTCAEESPQLLFLALHARRYLRCAGLQHEPTLSMADLTWFSDFQRRVDDMLERSASRHDRDESPIERTWNLLTWETAAAGAASAADAVDQPVIVPVESRTTASNREDALKVAAILLCASVAAFFLHRPTSIALGVLTAAIYTYIALLPPLRKSVLPSAGRPSIFRSIPALAALTHEQVHALRKHIAEERIAMIRTMEAAPCGDPPLDPYEVVDLADE